MIPVQEKPAPDRFDQAVRQKGLAFLRRMEVAMNQPLPDQIQLEPYWRACLDDLHEAYGGICAYLCVYIERIVGGVSVDHFVAKSKKASLAYEWSNYRLACMTMNCRKRDYEDALDPFTILDGWFQLEFDEGIEIVQRQLADRTVKAGEEELFKSRAKEKGDVKIIDLLSARLDAKTDSYLATLPSLRLNDARISSDMVRQHERMLTGGFYAEINLAYDGAIAQEKNGRPFGIEGLREIQLSKRDVLDDLTAARAQFSTADWKTLLLRSIGIESAGLSERAKDAFLLRMVPFVERNYNLVELGPRGTGKSHLFQQISPYAHLISGDKDPRQHEFSVQLRAFDASKSGAKLGIAILVAMCTALLKKTTRGGLIIIGEINLGGSIEPIHNAITVAEMAVEKGATALLMPVACRRQLFDLSDDMATKVDIQFFTDGREALLKAIQE